MNREQKMLLGSVLIGLITAVGVWVILFPASHDAGTAPSAGTTPPKLYTVEHHRHLFVVSSAGGLLHHPDCPLIHNNDVR